jgi:ubiquinone/menaquinone biosynthesis C-methylase UbiE
VDVRGAVALDYGCGDGSFSHLLASRGAHVSGVDISPERIRQAEAATVAGNSGSAKFFVSDVHQTPFPDNSFDYVVGNGALHHLDLDRAYAEIARVLKPAGRAFFMEPMYRHPGLRLVRRLTPSLRSPCEKPLDFSDMERAKRWFRKVSHREHFLFAACTAPAALLGRATALTMINLVDRFDRGLMRLAPPLRELAWLTMLEMEK